MSSAEPRIATASSVLISYISDLARSGSELNAYAREFRRRPGPATLVELARPSLVSAKASLEHMLRQVNEAIDAVDAELAPEPQKLGAVAADVVSRVRLSTPDGLRLVPRNAGGVTRIPVAVKSAGAMGVVTPRGDGPEAA